MPWWAWLLTGLGTIVLLGLIWFGIFIWLMSKGDNT